MRISRLSLVYFSPTGTTQRVLRAAAEYLCMEADEYDLTALSSADTQKRFGPDELVLIGSPVYGGRIPQTMTDRLHGIRGENTPAAVLVTYGERAYEDALLELRNEAVLGGFRPAGAMAVVAEHSVIRSIAAGRPNNTDWAILSAFCGRLRTMLDHAGSGDAILPPAVPGSEPYRKYAALPMVPRVSGKCVGCGKCAENCPVGAIDPAAPRRTDKALCIGCSRCVRVCPQSARELPLFKRIAGRCILSKAEKENREPEVFF